MHCNGPPLSPEKGPFLSLGYPAHIWSLRRKPVMLCILSHTSFESIFTSASCSVTAALDVISRPTLKHTLCNIIACTYLGSNRHHMTRKTYYSCVILVHITWVTSREWIEPQNASVSKTTSGILGLERFAFCTYILVKTGNIHQCLVNSWHNVYDFIQISNHMYWRN